MVQNMLTCWVYNEFPVGVAVGLPWLIHPMTMANWTRLLIETEEDWMRGDKVLDCIKEVKNDRKCLSPRTCSVGRFSWLSALNVDLYDIAPLWVDKKGCTKPTGCNPHLLVLKLTLNQTIKWSIAWSLSLIALWGYMGHKDGHICWELDWTVHMGLVLPAHLSRYSSLTWSMHNT